MTENKERNSWAMYKKYLISFKQNDGRHRVYDADTHTISTMNELPKDICKFNMLTVDDNQATDKDLLAYAKMFMAWCRELRFAKNGLSFKYVDPAHSFSDYVAVTTYFKARCDFKDHEPINAVEYIWFEKCANSGIQYLNKVGVTQTGLGYDFKNQYALALHSDKMIPTKPGKEKTLDSLPKRKDLKHGIYLVKITCDNENFRKMFAFSRHHGYLHESLAFAMKHQKRFNVKIELIVDGKPNAYLYRTKDLVKLSTLTDRWFTEATTLRKEFPKNRLLKHLLSSAWGMLNATNKKIVNLEEMMKLDVGVSMKHEYTILEKHEFDPHTNKEPYWVVMETKKPYKHNIRLKPWITAIARNMTAEVVLKDVDNVIRVHTDGIIFKNEMTFDDPNLIAEEKTTGEIFWVNNNCYHNLTTDYKTKGFDNWQEKENNKA